MSDYRVYLDPWASATVRRPEPVPAAQPVDSTMPAPVAAVDQRIAVMPPSAPRGVPAPSERLRAEVLTADARASSLATRQSSYAELDRALALTSLALRTSPAPVDVSGALAGLGPRLQRIRADQTRALGAAVHQVNELTVQAARLSTQPIDSTGLDAATDPAYRRDAAIQALARLTGATVSNEISQARAGDTGLGDRAVNLDINGFALVNDGRAVTLDLAGDQAGRLVVTGPGGVPVSVDTGVVGGRLHLVNDVLPQVIRGATALSTIVGAVSHGQASAVAGTALAAVAAAARAGEVAPAAAAFLDSVRSGGVLQPTASLVSRYLGAVDPTDGPREQAAVSALQQVNHLIIRLGTAAEAAAAQAANTTAAFVTSSAPNLATARITGDAELGSVSFAVFSAASPAGIVSDKQYVTNRPLNGDLPFTFGLLTMDDAGGHVQRVYEMGPQATIRDVVATINSANTDVAATLSTLAAGTVRLSLISLRTGRFSELTVFNGQQPPAVSMILGRFNRLLEAQDTVLRVDSGPHAGSLAVSSSPDVSGLLEGVTVSVRQADPTRALTLTITPDPRILAHKVDMMVTSAAGVLAGVWQATRADTPLAGDRMLAGLAGRVISAVTVVAPVAGLPGLALRGGGLSFDREAFVRTFVRDPMAAEASVSTVAARLATVSTEAADPLLGYLAARLVSAQQPRQGYDAAKSMPQERLTSRQSELKRRGAALESLLGHLGEQTDWLRAQLQPAGADTAPPALVDRGTPPGSRYQDVGSTSD